MIGGRQWTFFCCAQLNRRRMGGRISHNGLPANKRQRQRRSKKRDLASNALGAAINSSARLRAVAVANAWIAGDFTAGGA